MTGRTEEFDTGTTGKSPMKPLKGKALVEHMTTHHGFVTWKTPAPNSREYKQWAKSHAEEYHGRWADQSDHHHGG